MVTRNLLVPQSLQYDATRQPPTAHGGVSRDPSKAIIVGTGVNKPLVAVVANPQHQLHSIIQELPLDTQHCDMNFTN